MVSAPETQTYSLPPEPPQDLLTIPTPSRENMLVYPHLIPKTLGIDSQTYGPFSPSDPPGRYDSFVREELLSSPQNKYRLRVSDYGKGLFAADFMHDQLSCVNNISLFYVLDMEQYLDEEVEGLLSKIREAEYPDNGEFKQFKGWFEGAYERSDGLYVFQFGILDQDTI